MSELADLHKKYDSVKVRRKYPYSHTYVSEIYPRHLEHRRAEPLTVLEIGIAWGGSLQAMRDWMPNAKLIGYDVDIVRTNILDSTRIHLFQGSQDDPKRLAELAAEHGPFDVIIDDACHLYEQQLTSLTHLWPHVKPNGLYFIEDIFTLLGKRGNASSQIFHHIKDKILTEEGFAAKHYITDKRCIVFYPTMIVLEKGNK